MSKCTVCGMDINANNPRFTSQHAAQTYEFCCPLCKGAFDAVPDRFVTTTPTGAAAPTR